MMRPVTFRKSLVVTAALLCFPGCYRMYQPYGYQGYPAGTYPQQEMYGAPMQTLTPGQPYLPGGSPAGVYPSSPSGTPTFQNPGLTPVPDHNLNSNPGNPPAWPANPGNPAGAPGGVPSPYYPNPNTTFMPGSPGGVPLQPIQQVQMQEPAPLAPPTVMREMRPVPPLHHEPEQAFALPRPAPPMNAEADPFSAAPGRLEPEGAAPIFAHKIPAQELEPFGRHPEMTWVRGIVSKEPQDGTWGIVYDETPDSEDKLAGHVALAPSPELDKLKNGDIVEIQGRIDPVMHDRLGKPVYVVSGLKKLVP
ncbi:hypothetical protein [Planctomicrobium sp. SH664]|uniref:hypothetical protein n=1 Tax=Planctomicrobium sp. SH664 TaxID=3448125 RepID=UPI003F5C7AF1